jgi:hypothetical protein
MLKPILILAASACLASPCVYAQRGNQNFARASSHADFDHRGGDHHGGHNGHYYFFGGVPYFFPFDAVGFGYPYYGYDYGFGYAAEGPDGPAPYGSGPYGNGPYEGRIDPSGGGQNGPSLPSVVQQQLSKRGYYKGSIDGKFGPQSREALSRFQHANGLQETGRIDEPTLMALGFADHR